MPACRVFMGPRPAGAQSVAAPHIALTGAARTANKNVQPRPAKASGTGISRSATINVNATMYNQHLYGSGMNIDSRGNIRVTPDATQIAYRFIASQTSTVSTFRFVQRGGSGYSLGTGGTYVLDFCDDDGTGKPGTVITSTGTFTPGNPAGEWERTDAVTFPSPPSTVSGHTYHVKGRNTHATPGSNYISFNEAYRFGTALNPRQKAFTNDNAILRLSGSTWTVDANHTPVYELAYANGQYDGNGYMGIIIGSHGNITGATTMVRERFTVTGGARTVTELWFRVGRQSGTDKVLLRLEDSGGTLIEEGLMVETAASFPLASPGATYSGDWAHYVLGTARVLANGSTYSLRVSCAGTSTWWAMPIAGGSFPTGGSPSEYDWASRRFTDGSGQKTTNSGGTWSALYGFLPENTQSFMVTT